MKQPLKGQYILATKYGDGDPHDPWCVGFLIGPGAKDRWLVGDAEYNPKPNGFRFSGYRHVGLIDSEFGDWLVKNAIELEASPAGMLNLWQMRSNRLALLCADDDEVADRYLDEDEKQAFRAIAP